MDLTEREICSGVGVYVARFNAERMLDPRLCDSSGTCICLEMF